MCERAVAHHDATFRRFTLEAAEAVLPTQPHTTGVLDLVLPLLDKNLLLAADESRFGMLETIRDYGRRKT